MLQKTHEKKLGRCPPVHLKPGGTVKIGDSEVTVYIPRVGRAVLQVMVPEGIDVFRLDGESWTQLPLKFE